jgi:hypothetical protein
MPADSITTLARDSHDWPVWSGHSCPLLLTLPLVLPLTLRLTLPVK